MDGINADDLKAARGLQYLEGKVEGRGRGQEKTSTGKAGTSRANASGGLEMCRRQVMVVAPGEKGAGPSGGSSGSKKSSKQGPSQVVKVVDHGVNQKEAIRRLFDAEIILRSYEDQLDEQQSLIQDYETLLRSNGLLKALEPKEVKAAAKSASIRATAVNLSGGTLPSETDRAQLRRYQASIKDANEAAVKAGEEPEEIDYAERKIPFWIRNDQKSRNSIEKLRNHLMRRYADEGQLTNVNAVDHLWQCGLDFAARWGGLVAEEVLKQNEQIEHSSRKMKRDALKETSVLRQHIKNMEKRYKELLDQAKKMHKQLREAQQMPRPVHMQGPAPVVRPPDSPKHGGAIVDEPPRNPMARSMASQIVAQWAAGGTSGGVGAGASAGGGAAGESGSLSPSGHFSPAAGDGSYAGALAHSNGFTGPPSAMAGGAGYGGDFGGHAGGGGYHGAAAPGADGGFAPGMGGFAPGGGGGFPGGGAPPGAFYGGAPGAYAPAGAYGAPGAPGAGAAGAGFGGHAAAGGGFGGPGGGAGGVGGHAAQGRGFGGPGGGGGFGGPMAAGGGFGGPGGGGGSFGGPAAAAAGGFGGPAAAGGGGFGGPAAAGGAGFGGPGGGAGGFGGPAPAGGGFGPGGAGPGYAPAGASGFAPGGGPGGPGFGHPGAHGDGGASSGAGGGGGAAGYGGGAAYGGGGGAYGAGGAAAYAGGGGYGGAYGGGGGPAAGAGGGYGGAAAGHGGFGGGGYGGHAGGVAMSHGGPGLFAGAQHYDPGNPAFNSGGFGGGVRGSVVSSNFDPSRFEQFPHERETQYRSLEDDEHIDATMDKAELEQMDNEIFEPLKMFDDDMKEMLIDCVNEKVRRILTLDPSKFQNGKLPFGLRPDNMAVGADELNRLRGIIQDLQDELDAVRKERDNLKSRLEALEGRMAIVRNVNEYHSDEGTPVVMPASPAGRGLSRSPSKSLSPSAPPSGPPSPTRQNTKDARDMISKEEFEKRMAQATKDLMRKIADLEAQLRAAQKLANKPPQIVEKEVVVEHEVVKEVQAPKSPSKTKPPTKIEDPLAGKTQKALRRTQDLLRRVLGVISVSLRKSGTKGQLGVEELIGKDGSPDASVEAHIESVAPFEIWVRDVLGMLGTAFAPKKKEPEPVVAPPTPDEGPAPVPLPPPTPKQKPQTPAATKPPEPIIPPPQPGDTEETIKLRELCKWQQEEIARLLLLVDELRKRIEGMGESAVSEGPGSPVATTMERFGLKEVAEARSQQRLKGVFERLYQDACQRITRYSLIRERMLAANALCSQVMAALSHRQTEDSSEGVPDFERLNATASAALRGMFYHTDYLFRATCEYAMAQGVENTLFKVRRDFSDYDASEDTEQPDHDEAHRRGGGQHRLPGRRSERPRKPAGQYPTSPQPGSQSASPAKPKKAAPLAEEHASFGQYVQALREANMEEEWKPKPAREKKMTMSSSGDFATLKAAVLEKGKDGGRMNKGGGLAMSQSLPALPKGRSFFQTPESPAGNTAAKLGAAAIEARSM